MCGHSRVSTATALVMLPHWQARRISIVTDPPQLVQSDGEVFGNTPIKVRVTGRTVRFIVTPQKAAALHNYTLEGEEADLPFDEPISEMPSFLQEPGPDDDEPEIV